jgi:pyruvate,water dikinase
MGKAKPGRYVFEFTAKRAPATVGNKAFNLHRLMQKGVRVPRTFVVSWDAYDRYAQDDVRVIEAVQKELTDRLDPARAYAVRSSANIEDTLEHSFAGQFKTVLGVQGEDPIVQAIWSVWATAHSPAVQTYLQKFPTDQRELRMAVIVQEMVKPAVSGVSFSRNPLTGEDEIIVEAVQGVGTALVQDGSTPLHWVSQRGQWKVRPKDSPVEESLIKEVVEQTRHIARMFKTDVDLEWVYDGQELVWVQMREISSLKHLIIYSNRIAKELLPGMIKPLVWSVNVPLVNTVWVDLLSELVGKNDLKLDDMARSFYYRTYFNLSALGRVWNVLGMPRESLEMMMGILPHVEGQRNFKPTMRMVSLMPRLMGFLWNKWRLGGRFEQEYPRLAARFDGYGWRSAERLSETELLEEIDQLYADVQRLVYYNINVPILMAIYNALLGRSLKRVGVDMAAFDLMEGMTEQLDFDPQVSLKGLRQAYADLDASMRERILECSYAEFQGLEGIALLQEKISDFLRRFGHLSDSGNDFSAVPWREKPGVVLKLVSQAAPTEDPPKAKVCMGDVKLKGLRGGWAKLMHRRAQNFRLYREQISSLYTFAYGLFRPYFLALGGHFATRRVLREPTDIFYLGWAEVREIVSGGLEKDYQALAEDRKVEMGRCQEVVLPVLIYGDVAPVVEVGAVEKLTGVATSRGYYSGPVKVVQGLEDFNKVQPGDVLVIPYSDVGWTPLFARVGAVVAESGGMLSHSSIVAREYQIPAVVSVAGAMRLHDGTLVSVDGFRGEVILHKEEGR